eukprot:30612-Pelagococcus_subviridis.AAC.17
MHPSGASTPPCHFQPPGTSEKSPRCSTFRVSGVIFNTLFAAYGMPYTHPSGPLMPPYHLFCPGGMTSEPNVDISFVRGSTKSTASALDGMP